MIMAFRSMGEALWNKFAPFSRLLTVKYFLQTTQTHFTKLHFYSTAMLLLHNVVLKNGAKIIACNSLGKIQLCGKISRA